MVAISDGSSSDGPHANATAEEWVFAAWTPDAALGVVSGHRIVGGRAWYWAALARAGQALLHVTDFDVLAHADPFVVEGDALWAEHDRVAPMEQWSISAETYASAIEDLDDALGQAYGTPTPIAFDLEWYATGTAVVGDQREEQAGVVHGTVAVAGHAQIELVEVPAHRWHRWTSADDGHLDPLAVPIVAAHTGVRAPFAFPDGATLDLVLTPAGWARRR